MEGNMGKEICPLNFYGQKRSSEFEDKVEKISKKCAVYEQNPLPSTIPKHILSCISDVWKVFPKQDECLSFISHSKLDLKAFSCEYKLADAHGKRNFLAAHPHLLWIRLNERPLKERCFYEIITSGSECKLYFDIEFDKRLNPELDGADTVRIFMKCVEYYIRVHFEKEVKIHDVLILDATTEKKFSCHLVYDTVIFNSNIHAGYFVLNIVEEITQKRVPSEVISAKDLSKLIVKSVSGNSVFVDTSVYSQNRNFRMLYCNKFGKNNHFEIGSDNEFTPDSLKYPGKTLNESYFYASLITNIKGKPNILTYAKVNVPSSAVSKFHSNKPKFSGCSKSVYAEIDDFISSIVQPGYIRKWSLLETSIIYEIGGNYRYCERIRRHHKSNHIKFIVNLKAMNYHQECFDYECKGFKSSSVEMPADIINWTDEDDFAEVF
ncbi:DNA-directed primase/polymerase protein-like [Artemia franciscana]